MGNFISSYISSIFDTVTTNLKRKQVRVWDTTNITPQSPQFIYPETNIDYINNKEDIGIALTAGGLRACVYSLGILRGLYKRNILQKAKYLVSVSGSSWLTSVLCYQKICDTSTFLGEYIPPEELTLMRLKENNVNEFVNVLCENKPDMLFIEDSLCNLCKNNPLQDAWSETIGNFIHNKYKLNDFITLPSIELLNKDCPYNIINGIAYSEDTKVKSIIEFTPLYYGIYVKNKGINMSGCYVEPDGLLYIKPPIQNHPFEETITIPYNNKKLSILNTAGISSNLIPVFLKLDNQLYNYLKYPYADICNQRLQFIDGGNTGDYVGLSSLLQRKVKNIILVCPINSSDDMSISITSMITNNTSLSNYFGMPDNNNKLQFFNSSYWGILKTKFYELIKNNKPLIVNMDIEVLPNEYYGIVGGYTASITFIHPYRNEWIDKLPKESKNLIMNNICKIHCDLSDINIVDMNFRNFPYTSYIHFCYSRELVNAMSQLACYDIMSSDIISTII